MPANSPNGDSWGLGSLNYTFLEGGWHWENFDLNLLDIGYAEVSATLDRNEGLSLSAFVSLWSPSASITICGIKFSVSAEVFSLGADLDVTNRKFSFKGGSEIGIGFSVER